MGRLGTTGTTSLTSSRTISIASNTGHLAPRDQSAPERSSDALGLQRHPWDSAADCGRLRDLAIYPESLRIWDCEPVNASAAYLFTTAERAKDMKQPPVYVY